MPKKNLPTIPELEKILGSKERTLFYLTWLKHDRNATKAYMELHPKVNKQSAAVLGSRMLSKVNITAIADAYGLNEQAYFKQLKEGMNAVKWNDFTGEREADHKTRKPYHDKLGKILDIETDVKSQVNIAAKDMSVEFVVNDG
jgi:hypothetical protein